MGVDHVPELLEHGRGRAAAEGDGISGLEVRRRDFNFRFRSAEHWLDVLPHQLRAGQDGLRAPGRSGAGGALAADARAVLERFNRAGERALVAPGEYLEVVRGEREARAHLRGCRARRGSSK